MNAPVVVHVKPGQVLLWNRDLIWKEARREALEECLAIADEIHDSSGATIWLKIRELLDEA